MPLIHRGNDSTGISESPSSSLPRNVDLHLEKSARSLWLIDWTSAAFRALDYQDSHSADKEQKLGFVTHVEYLRMSQRASLRGETRKPINPSGPSIQRIQHISMATIAQLESLKQALSFDRPPLCSGVISPSPEGLYLYYGKKNSKCVRSNCTQEPRLLISVPQVHRFRLCDVRGSGPPHRSVRSRNVRPWKRGRLR